MRTGNSDDCAPSKPGEVPVAVLDVFHWGVRLHSIRIYADRVKECFKDKPATEPAGDNSVKDGDITDVDSDVVNVLRVPRSSSGALPADKLNVATGECDDAHLRPESSLCENDRDPNRCGLDEVVNNDSDRSKTNTTPQTDTDVPSSVLAEMGDASDVELAIREKLVEAFRRDVIHDEKSTGSHETEGTPSEDPDDEEQQDAGIKHSHGIMDIMAAEALAGTSSAGHNEDDSEDPFLAQKDNPTGAWVSNPMCIPVSGQKGPIFPCVDQIASRMADYMFAGPCFLRFFEKTNHG